MKNRRTSGCGPRAWIIFGVLAGLIVGPVVLRELFLWEHVRRYHTTGEFWGDFVAVPLGALIGSITGGLLVTLGRYLGDTSRPHRLLRKKWLLPLTGRWLVYLVLPIAFLAVMCLTFMLVLLYDLLLDQHVW